MSSPRPNLTPLIALIGVTLLFAVTWSHDHPVAAKAVSCAVAAPVQVVQRYPARTGLFTSGRASVRNTIAGEPNRTAQDERSGTIAVRRPEAEPARVDATLPAAPAAVDWLAELIQTAEQRLPR